MKNSTKQKKHTAEKLREQMTTTVGIWRGIADNLEKKAETEEAMMAETLCLCAAVFRGCAVDLDGVIKGTVILSKTDTPFVPIPSIVNNGTN